MINRGLEEKNIIYKWELGLENFLRENSFLDKQFIRPQIAFAANYFISIHHFKNIWKNLNKKDFVIIYCSPEDKENKAIINYAEQNGIEAHYIGDVITSNFMYHTLVSHHYPMGGYLNAAGIEYFGFKCVAEKHVRITYSLGKSNWNYSNWNSHYDLILCFGPEQAENFKKVSTAEIKEVGYPRLDDYFNNPINKEETLKGFNLDPEKETVVWLPTHSEISSIKYFTKEVEKLSEKYNIIVKTHPMTSKEQLDILEKSKINVKIFDPEFDNLILFGLADYILCDVGGSAFCAIYLDKNVILLNSPGVENDGTIGLDSADIKIREQLPNIYINEKDELLDILTSEDLWIEQKSVLEDLRKRFFAPYYGTSSKYVAEILMEFHSKTLKVGLEN